MSIGSGVSDFWWSKNRGVPLTRRVALQQFCTAVQNCDNDTWALARVVCLLHVILRTTFFFVLWTICHHVSGRSTAEWPPRSAFFATPFIRCWLLWMQILLSATLMSSPWEAISRQSCQTFTVWWRLEANWVFTWILANVSVRLHHMQYCIPKLCTVISTLRCAVLTVLWIGLSHWAHFTVCRFVCVYLCVFCVFYFILHSCCIIVSTVGWTWWDWCLILRTYLPSVL